MHKRVSNWLGWRPWRRKNRVVQIGAGVGRLQLSVVYKPSVVQCFAAFGINKVPCTCMQRHHTWRCSMRKWTPHGCARTVPSMNTSAQSWLPHASSDDLSPGVHVSPCGHAVQLRSSPGGALHLFQWGTCAWYIHPCSSASEHPWHKCCDGDVWSYTHGRNNLALQQIWCHMDWTPPTVRCHIRISYTVSQRIQSAMRCHTTTAAWQCMVWMARATLKLRAPGSTNCCTPTHPQAQHGTFRPMAPYPHHTRRNADGAQGEGDVDGQARAWAVLLLNSCRGCVRIDFAVGCGLRCFGQRCSQMQLKAIYAAQGLRTTLLSPPHTCRYFAQTTHRHLNVINPGALHDRFGCSAYLRRNLGHKCPHGRCAHDHTIPQNTTTE